MLELNKIYCGDCLEIMKEVDNESINCVVTSPPYWALRDYGTEPIIWDGDENCEHVFEAKKIELDKTGNYRGDWDRPSRKEYAKTGNLKKCPVCEKEFKAKIGQKFCSHKCLNTLSNELRTNTPEKSSFCLKCGAWYGSLGLESAFDLYIKHLCDIFDEVKRVLRKDGTCWVVIGDTYSATRWSDTPSTTGVSGKHCDIVIQKNINLPDKSLVMIPFRFAIEMVNHGWILRNTIIWHKPNCMPSSAKDRFTVDFEYVFFFVKNNVPLYWINEKTNQAVKKQPKGTGGIEWIDWEWIEHSACKGKGCDNKRCVNGKVKSSFWKGRDYWFEQLLDEYTEPLDRWGGPEIRKSSHKYIEIGEPKLGKFGATSMFRKGRPVRPNEEGRNKRCVWQIQTAQFPEAHFAVFPEELIEPMIRAGCPEDGIILDPFVGSGTTPVVAKKQGKNFMGIDISSKYVDIANKRLANTYYQGELIK